MTSIHRRKFLSGLICWHDGEELWWTSNRDGHRASSSLNLRPGNLLLEVARSGAGEGTLPRRDRPGAAMEPLSALLAASKILNPQYGTRFSTVLLREMVAARATRNESSPPMQRRRDPPVRVRMKESLERRRGGAFNRAARPARLYLAPARAREIARAARRRQHPRSSFARRTYSARRSRCCT